MVAIHQMRPSALSCVYSLSAHDIRAGETNLSSMKGPWPWYEISWSETYQATDTPLFLPGEKKMKPSLTDKSMQNYELETVYRKRMSFIFLVLSCTLACLLLSYREIQMENTEVNAWFQSLLKLDITTVES